jgi:hypothetical protein
MKKLWSFLTTEFTSYADALTCVGWTTELDKVFYVFIQNERSPPQHFIEHRPGANQTQKETGRKDVPREPGGGGGAYGAP